MGSADQASGMKRRAMGDANEKGLRSRDPVEPILAGVGVACCAKDVGGVRGGEAGPQSCSRGRCSVEPATSHWRADIKVGGLVPG